MKTKILKTEQEYNEAYERIFRLINSSEKYIEPDSPEGEEIELEAGKRKISFIIIN